jgi:hypothetical protein
VAASRSCSTLREGRVSLGVSIVQKGVTGRWFLDSDWEHLGFGRQHVERAWRSAMGSRQCELEGCTKWAQKLVARRMHRARWGQAVPAPGLPQVSSRRHGALRVAWRRQAVPARGLPYCCSRRHAELRGAWRGQAVPARGLQQVGSRRYRTLVMNLQFSILMAQTTDPSSWR